VAHGEPAVGKMRLKYSSSPGRDDRITASAIVRSPLPWLNLLCAQLSPTACAVGHTLSPLAGLERGRPPLILAPMLSLSPPDRTCPTEAEGFLMNVSNSVMTADPLLVYLKLIYVAVVIYAVRVRTLVP